MIALHRLWTALFRSRRKTFARFLDDAVEASPVLLRVGALERAMNHDPAETLRAGTTLRNGS